MKHQREYQHGQSLVEMVVVIGVVVLLAVGIIAGTTASLSATENAQTRSNALKFASEGIERTRELRDAGWEIASHSLWHPYLTKSPAARAEIFDSKKKLEQRLGVEITTFAYPFGDYDPLIQDFVKEAGYSIEYDPRSKILAL